MYFYVVCCLFDCTKTGVLTYRPGINTLHQRNQQRNWQVINQLIQLRVQPLLILDPISVEADLKDFDFSYQGRHKVWYTVFAVDRAELYNQKQDSVYALKEDFDRIPMISGLDETVVFAAASLQTQGNQKNICFYTQSQWNNRIDIDFANLEMQVNGK